MRSAKAATTALACGVVGAMVVVAGCGPGSGASTAGVSPAVLLRQAKATIDAASAVHFSLTSAHATGSGTVLVGGQGDAARPDELSGTFTVEVSNLPITAKVIAIGGKVYLEAPFSNSYTPTDPAKFGIGNPAKLFDRTDGLSSLLPALTDLRPTGRVRIGSEVADQVQGVLPGAQLPVLPDSDRSVPVTVSVDVVPSSHQVRELVLTGPFTSAASSTYTVELTDYDEVVHITAPPS